MLLDPVGDVRQCGLRQFPLNPALDWQAFPSVHL